MDKLDELRNDWKSVTATEDAASYDEETIKAMVATRAKKHVGATMRYFWPVFFCNILVYAMLSHVVVKYWGDPATMGVAVAGIAAFIPFTWVLMKKFKTMATLRVGRDGITTAQEYVARQHSLIKSFFRFKWWYELFLIPTASLIGVWITFELFVPGGALAYLNGALICYVLTVISCAAAIIRENRRNFTGPIRELENILGDFRKG